MITYQNQHRISSRANSFDEIDSDEHEHLVNSIREEGAANGTPMFFENSINSGNITCIRKGRPRSGLLIGPGRYAALTNIDRVA